MRKVIYKEWIRGVETEEYKRWKKAGGFFQDGKKVTQPKNFIDGTSCYIEKEGLFHGFFSAATENNDGSFGNYTEALIETEDGSIVNVSPSLIRFVDKPEYEQLAEFAKAAMQGIIANPDWVKSARIADDFDEFKERVSLASIDIANTMIAELKKQKP